MPDDAELLRRIERGDRAAFDALVARHARYLHGVAHALVGNSADAEDLVQETLIAVLNGKFRGESSVRTWMVRILVKRAGMLRRSRGAKARMCRWPRHRRSKHDPVSRARMPGSI